MARVSLVSLILLALMGTAVAESVYESELPSLELYLQQVDNIHTYDTYSGQNDVLAEDADANAEEGMYAVGAGIPAAVAPGELFGAPFIDGEWTVYLAGVQSVDAKGLRLSMQLSEMPDGQELWVLDPIVPRAFGPYRNRQHVDGGKWLASVTGDLAVLVVRDANGNPPAASLIEISHFFREQSLEKEKTCHINIECENTPVVQHTSSGVGYVRRSLGGGTTLIGSGTLINIPGTTVLEPYFLTAGHVIGTQNQAASSEVVWDYRSSTCTADDSPYWGSLPRSSGEELLAYDSDLDTALVRLDYVPNGAYGRAYVGWDRVSPFVGADVVGIHHPDGAHMRISFGEIDAVDQPVNTFHHLQRVGWDRDGGITEAGSSGSCLLYATRFYRISGVLCAGPNAVCGSSNNYDYYTSFREFANYPPCQEYFAQQYCDTVYVSAPGEGEGEGEEGEGEGEEGEGEGEEGEGEGEGENPPMTCTMGTTHGGPGAGDSVLLLSAVALLAARFVPRFRRA